MVSRLTWTVSSTAGLAQVVVSLTVGSPSERCGVGAGPGPGASAVQATGGPGAPASPASSQGGLGTETHRGDFDFSFLHMKRMQQFLLCRLKCI